MFTFFMVSPPPPDSYVNNEPSIGIPPGWTNSLNHVGDNIWTDCSSTLVGTFDTVSDHTYKTQNFT